MRSGLPVNLNFSAAEVADFRAEIPHLQRGHRFTSWKPRPTFPAGYTTLVGPIIDTHIQAPYANVYTVGVQRTLGSRSVVNAAYVGTRGNNFRLYRWYNLPDRVTGIRPNPDLNQNLYMDSSGRSTYNSLQTSFQQRLTRRLQFNLNYTLSSTRANYDGDNSGRSVNDDVDVVQDFFDLDASWGPAIGDVRHNFVGDAIYQLPGERTGRQRSPGICSAGGRSPRSSGRGPASRLPSRKRADRSAARMSSTPRTRSIRIVATSSPATCSI